MLALVAAVCIAQPAPTAFTGARLIPISGPEIERGVLVVHGGTIAAIGAEGEVAIPAGARRVDVAGKVIMPGLVDTHSHVGGIGGADGSATIQPGIRIYDSLNMNDAGFRRALAGGLTTLNVMPGSGHLLSGQTIYLKLRARPAPGSGSVPTVERFFIFDADGQPMGGIKMANGTNSLREPPFSGTRGKSAAMVREAFVRAREYRDKIARAAGDPAKLPPRDLGMEALVEVLDGKRMVHHHTHRADDVMTVLRLKEEFGFRVVLHHVSEAWKVAPEIARAGVPCSIILVDSPGGKLEAAELSYETGAVLEKAGVNVAFHTDDWITDSRLFRRMAALAVRAGMSREAALRSLTLAGAEMLDLAHRTGSLEPGKDADFIIMSADPFSLYSTVEQTWVEGVLAFDRTDPDDALFAVGGYGAARDQAPYFCCYGQ